MRKKFHLFFKTAMIAVLLFSLVVGAVFAAGEDKAKAEKKKPKISLQLQLTQTFQRADENLEEATYIIDESILEMVKGIKFKLANNDPQALELYQNEINELIKEQKRISGQLEQSRKKIQALKKVVMKKRMVQGSVMEMQKILQKGKAAAVPEMIAEMELSMEKISLSDKEDKLTPEEREKYKKAKKELEKLLPIIEKHEKNETAPDPEILKPLFEIFEILEKK